MSHRDGVVGSGESAVLEERRRARHMQGAADMLAGETAETLGAPCGLARRDFSRAELHVVNIRHIQHHAAQLILPLRPAWYTEGGTDGTPARGWPS